MSGISIVVPTRDRPAALARCLDALAGQRSDGAVEVVVVDDGSSDRAAVEAAVRRCPTARLVRLPGRGPAAARNAGVRAATGEVVCFTDDDCVAEPDWAVRLALAASAPAVGAAGGETRGDDPSDPFAAATDAIIGHLARHTPFLATNNVACRLDVARRHPFDERFTLAGGEDREWCARLAAGGLALVLEPAAVVRHGPAPGLRGFWQQHVRYGRGARRLAALAGEGPGLQRPRFYGGLVVRAFRRGFWTGALVLLAQVATAVGYALERRSGR